jgi:hypothetical protein
MLSTRFFIVFLELHRLKLRLKFIRTICFNPFRYEFNRNHLTYLFLSMRFIIALTLFKHTIASNYQALTRCMNANYTVGHERASIKFWCGYVMCNILFGDTLRLTMCARCLWEVYLSIGLDTPFDNIGRFKKSLLTLKEYANLYIEHKQRFELS